MTREDEIYADWLDLLGSDEISDTNEAITADLKAMRERAEASHGEGAGMSSGIRGLEAREICRKWAQAHLDVGHGQ